MKKRFLLSACVLIVIAVCFVIYAMWHPELSFPWSASITYVLYGLYVDGIVLLFTQTSHSKLGHKACMNAG